MTATAVDTTVEKLDALVLEAPHVKEEHKVFIGNLSFKTKKASLISFASTSGKVVDANIITKYNSSLGYGFITFETEKDAEKAVKDLNSKLLDGRQVNLEVARPQAEPTTPKAKPHVSCSGDKSAATILSTKDETTIKDEATIKKEAKDGVVPVKKTKVPIKKEVVATATATATATDIVTSSNEQEKTAEQIARRKRIQKIKKRQNKKTSARAAEASKSTLFVGNLPYATTDDDLKEIFKDYVLVSAQVSRMNNGCSKGYGFVELDSEKEQLKALAFVKDVVLEGRSIYSKIAHSDQKVSAVENDIKDPTVDVGKEEIPSKDSVVDALQVQDTKK